MTAKVLIVCAWALLTTASISSAKEWRGIVPLHSTCEDVKRTLNVSTCESTQEIEDGRVYIAFSKKPCDDGWNVPSGTVLSITFYPKTKPLLIDLGVDLGKYEKEETPYPSNYVFYSNKEEGITITVTPDGKVDSINYYAAAKDSYLRYPSSTMNQPESSGNPHGTRKFDEYEDLPIDEERKRLDDFARKLKRAPEMQGYIIAYGSRRAHVGEAQARAERAKNYLVNAHGIKGTRITTVDGGYREELTVEIFGTLKGGVAPTAQPTVCPSEVQIIDQKETNGSRRPTRP